MIKVSVIVPVYNQEKYLKRCADSILNQTMKDIEVIFVDDGSTDSSLEILREYEKNDERVRVLTQQNMYAGVARNNGIKDAKGEYAVFWDSDDYFAENALDALYSEAKQYDADICVGEAVKEDTVTGVVNKSIHYIHKKRLPEKRPFNIDDIPQYIFNISNNSPWNKMYRLDFIRETGLQFQNIRRLNDAYFVMMAFALAKSITVTDDITVYYQYRNEDSLSNNAYNNREYVIKAFGKVKNELEKNGLWNNEKVRESFINKAFSTVSSQFSLVDDYEVFKDLFHYYKETVLSELGINNDFCGELFVAKNDYELRHMLSQDVDEYIFSMLCYYSEQSVKNKNDYLDTKEDLLDTRGRLRDTREKLSQIHLESIERKNKILELRAKVDLQKTKIAEQKERIENLKEKNGILKQKNSDQKERITELKQKTEEQKKLLNLKLVKLALKIAKLFRII